MGRFSKKADIDTDEATDTTISTEDAMSTDVFDDDFDVDSIDDAEAVEVPADVPAEAEPEPDISSFVALVDSVISRDAEGEAVDLTDEQIAQVQTSYRTLTRKEKNLAKNHLSEKMESAVMEDDDIALAKVYLELSNKVVETPKGAGRKAATPKALADPTEKLVKLIAKLDLARALVQIPAEFDAEDIERRAGELFEQGAADVKKDEPEFVWVKQALKLAVPTSGGGFPTGRKRHSVANHIAEAFANLNSGESLTIDEIVNFKSEEYGDDSVSKAAVMAHLESKKFIAASSVQLGATDDGEVALIKK